MAILSRTEMLRIQVDLDKYRSKYKHNDLTPYTWNYSGSEPQHWTGEVVSGGKCICSSQITSPTLGTQYSTYKYFTMCYTGNRTQIDIDLGDINNDYWSGLTNVAQFYLDGKRYVSIDLSDATNWSSARHIRVKPSEEIAIIYLKVDKLQVFTDFTGLTEAEEFNVLASPTAQMADPPEGPENYVPTQEDVDNLKASNFKTATWLSYSQIKTILNSNRTVAYNGCATCDSEATCTTANVRTCSTCDGQRYGYHDCTCDGACNAPDTPASCPCEATKYIDPEVLIPVPATGYFAATHSYSWRTKYADAYKHWRGISSYDWGENKVWVYHGQWVDDVEGGYGNHKGFLFFDYSNMRTVLKGTKITSATLRLTRVEIRQGYPTSLDLHIALHNLEPSVFGTLDNPPTISSYNTTIDFPRGDTKEVPIPVSYMNAIRDGTAKGIVLYVVDGNNRNYASFEPAPKNAGTYNGRTPKYVTPSNETPRLTVNYTKSTPTTTCTCYQQKYGYVPANPGCKVGYGHTDCHVGCDVGCYSYTCGCDQPANNYTCRDCHNVNYNTL